MQAFEQLDIGRLAQMTRAEAEAEIRARVQTVYVGNDVVLSRVLGYYKMFLSTTDLGFSSHVMLDGYWEIWLTLLMARMIEPGMSAIDVGAGFGYYSVLLGAAVGPSGRLIAVEPVPTTMALLRRTVALNGFGGWTDLVEAAVTAPGIQTVDMYIPPHEPKNATVVPASNEQTIEVRATCLDALTHGLSDLHFIKIDAEGAELTIFEGMKETLRRFRPNVVVEFNGGRYADAPAFLGSLRKEFKVMSALDFTGDLRPISEDEVLARDTTEDWLLFFSSRD